MTEAPALPPVTRGASRPFSGSGESAHAIEPGELSDRALIAQVACGDSRALDALYRRHAPVARALAFRVLRDSALAEEAVQEALVSVWRSAPATTPTSSSLRHWICLLTHRRAVGLARREARLRLADGHARELHPASYSAEEVVSLRFERRPARDDHERRSNYHRELFEPSGYSGLTHLRPAKHLAIPPTP
jgi:RNA polymerase sigma-70 factor, ECF subfamily